MYVTRGKCDILRPSLLRALLLRSSLPRDTPGFSEFYRRARDIVSYCSIVAVFFFIWFFSRFFSRPDFKLEIHLKVTKSH